MLFCFWCRKHKLILSPGNLQWFNEVVASELLVLFVGRKKTPQTFVLIFGSSNAYGLF